MSELQFAGFLGRVRDARPDGHRVDAWSVYFSESRGLSLGVKDCEIGNPHAPLKLGESCGARYRFVWDDGTVSRGYVERRLLENDPDEAISAARAAAYPDPDSAWVLGQAKFPDVELYDPSAAAAADGDAAELAARLRSVRHRVAEGGLRTWSGSFSAGRSRSRVLSSAGLDASSRGTSAGWHVTFDGELGDGFAARGFETAEAFERRLDALVATVELLRREAPAPEAGVRPVILHPEVVERFVLGTLIENLNGATVAHGESHFRREQFGSDDPVLREDLGLRIDPVEPLKSGSYRYTTEGVPAAPCVFVERGRLVRPILDLKYARRLGLEPTPLPSDSDTLYLEGPPPLALDEALARAAGGCLVLSVLGVHTQDRASGDFSLSAPQALVVKDGRLAGRLRATISGNLFERLASDDLHLVRFDGEHVPGLLFPCRLDPR